MRPMETCANLADLRKFLLCMWFKAAQGSKTEKQFDNWWNAVNAARDYIIAHETMNKLQEDDEK